MVDCLDNLETRRLVSQAAHRAGIHFVHGAIAGQEGFVMWDRPGLDDYCDKLYPKGRSAGATAEQQLGVPTLTPAATSVLQSLFVCNALLGNNISASAALWHLDLSVPELERLFI